MKYSEAFEQLEEIISEIEDEQIGIDELTQKIKRASELISYCKVMISNTEKEIQKLLSNEVT
jgi:exodeoxyribonuclease VII small subunit